MSQNPPAPLAESPAASHSDTLAALARALDYAAPGRFVLAFAKCNTPLQRSKLVDELKTLLEPLNVTLLEVELKEPIEKLLPLLQEKLAGSYLAPLKAPQLESPALVHEGQPKPAIFVYGLEHSIPSSDPDPAIFSHLNLARELFRDTIPCPLVIWLPDYALTMLARGAPDFWAWRSGVYEFAADVEIVEILTQKFLYSNESNLPSSLSATAKLERLNILARLLDDYRELGDRLDSHTHQIDALFQMGNLKEDLGELSEAYNLYNSALALVDNLGNQQIVARLHNSLGNIAQERGDFADATVHYEKSLEFYNKSALKPEESYVLGNLANLYVRQGMFEYAREKYQRVLEVAKDLSDKSSSARAYNGLGQVAYISGDPLSARSYYLESLQIEREIGDTYGMARTFVNLASLSRMEGNLHQARADLLQSLQLFEQMGDKRGRANSLLQLGRLSLLSGLFEEAKHYYEKGLQIATDLGNGAMIANTLHQLGTLALYRGDIKEARHQYNESLRLARQLGYKQGIAATLAQKASLETTQNNLDDALLLIKDAEKLFAEIDSPILLEQAKRQREQIELKMQSAHH